MRSFSESSPIGKRMSSRFVAGMTLDEALHASDELNRQGMAVTLDALGESVLSEEHARRTGKLYAQMLEAIALRGLNANVSLKLTQMGMDVDPLMAEEVVGELVEQASHIDNFVRLDMEGSGYTEATVAMTERLHAKFGPAGTVMQAYLYRTEQDIERLLGQGIRIRLCKGAYKEPASLAFPDKIDVDGNYVKLAKRCMTSGVFCGMATHDEKIIEELKRFATEKKLPKNAFEFQMLYGVRRDLQRALVKQGWGVRVYVPFGPEWYPYFMRRLAERPANVLFLAKNFFRN
ncbi:proline dehydrogenase family protein [Terriglobus tenax]|uniref:proline dehydrogenase family protein n=1 Tax=Terriglobus tenax TaxID=1111115 RepID=UPI0021DFB386|nr:proline dehydrogenase family protein [Terriglobus tenax]